MSCFKGNCFFHQQHSINFVNETLFAFSSPLNFTKMKRLSISWPPNRSALSEQIQSIIVDRPHVCEIKWHFKINLQLWLIRGINCLPQKYEQIFSENFKFWRCCKVDGIKTRWTWSSTKKNWESIFSHLETFLFYFFFISEPDWNENCLNWKKKNLCSWTRTMPTFFVQHYLII